MTPTFQTLETAVTLSGNLETDLLQHPGLFFHVGMGAAKAEADLDDIKYQLACAEAECQEIIRTAAAVAAEKVTETLIAGRVKEHAIYKGMHSQYVTALRLSKEWKALFSAYESRGHTLHNLVLLATKGIDSSGVNGPSYDQLRREAAARRTPPIKPPVRG